MSDPNDDDDDLDEDDVDDDSEEDDAEDEPKSKKAKHTDDDLARVGTREHRKGLRAGKRAAAAEVAAKLGMTVDEAVAALAKSTKKKADDDEEEDESRTTAIDERDRTAAQREERATIKENTADVVVALVTQGLDRELARQLAKSVDIDLTDTELDDDDVEEAVEKFKALMPQLFEQGDGDDSEDDDTDEKRTPTDSTPRGKRPKKKAPSSSPDARARKMLLARHPHLAKQSQDA